MQGACGGPVPMEMKAAVPNRTVPLRPLAANQCLLLVYQGGFQDLGDGSVWLDNLYIRKVTTADNHQWAFSLFTACQWDTEYRLTVSPSTDSELLR